MNHQARQIICESFLFIELEAQNYQSPNVSISHQFAIAPLESYSIVTSIPCYQEHTSFVECYERECDASEENKSQNINLEVMCTISYRPSLIRNDNFWTQPGHAMGDVCAETERVVSAVYKQKRKT